MLTGQYFSSKDGAVDSAEGCKSDDSRKAVEAEQAFRIRIRKALKLDHRGGKRTAVDVFTMTLGGESITLLPLKTWSQLDVFKWRVRGKLPGTPPGLEITPEHVKVAGEIVSTSDPAGCAQLERAFNSWLASERQRLESEAQAAPAAGSAEPTTEDEPLHFEIETDAAGQPHIRCFEGKETVVKVALTAAGLSSLVAQGLMRKPGAWKIGALRDWIEMDGELFKFRNDSTNLARFERFLNENYLPRPEPNSPPDVLVFPNPASSSGLDIQFTSLANGLAENRRRHMDPDALELLSDPSRCRVLRKGVLVKLTPPNLIFKQKTANGGEQPLEPSPENIVAVSGGDGQGKAIDLSQPVSHLGLQASELTAVFNHPAINRQAFRAKQAQEKAA